MTTTATTIDSQAVAISGPETDDADEPPICGSRSPSIIEKHIRAKDDGDSPSPPTAGGSVFEIGSSDGTLTTCVWDGSPGSAHLIDAMDVASQLEVNPRNGLSTAQATARLERDGHNKIDGADTVSIAEIFLRQVSNSLTIVLLIAMALSYGTLDFIEGAVISAVILLNIVLGFVQDFRAEKTMKSLLSLAAPSSQVIRNNGKIEVVKADTLVVGDIVRLATGVLVPADLRIIDSSNLEIEEALLTGESLPAAKHADAITPGAGGEVPLGDRVNMAYSATTVTRGRATGVVVAIGMKTQVGNVAQLLRGHAQEEKSPNFAVRFLRKLRSGFKSILGLVGTSMQVKLSKFVILLFGLAIP